VFIKNMKRFKVKNAAFFVKQINFLRLRTLKTNSFLTCICMQN
jgi:hypothetical protein